MDIPSHPTPVGSLRVVRAFLPNLSIACLHPSPLSSAQSVTSTPLPSVRQAPLRPVPQRRCRVPSLKVATGIRFYAVPKPPSTPLSRPTRPRSQYFGTVIITVPALGQRQRIAQRNTLPPMLPPLAWCSARIPILQCPKAVPCGTMHRNDSLNLHMEKDELPLERLGTTRPPISTSNFLPSS